MSDPDYISRSARRQAGHDALVERQDLLDALARLPAAEREALPADAELKTAIELLSGMKADSARRRLIRHLARQTATAAWPPLEAVIARSKASRAEIAAFEHDAEAWRARLLAEGDAAIDALVAAHPEADRSRLRQLVRNANREDSPATRRGRRLLLRAVRALLLPSMVVGGEDEDDPDDDSSPG